MIMSICDNPNVLELLKYIKIIIKTICIIVPVILLIYSTIHITKEITGDGEKTIGNIIKQIKNKCIAAILIFLIPTFVSLIVSISSNDANNYKSCLDNASNEGIEIAYKNEATKLIDNYRNTLSDYDYQKALETVNKLNTDGSLDYEKQLLEYYKSIDEAIEKLSLNYSEENYNKLKEIINKVSDETIRQNFLNKLESIKLDPKNVITKKYSSLSEIPFATTVEEASSYMKSTNKLDSNNKTSNKGTYKTATVTDSGGIERTFNIYLPYGYTTSKKYNVLILVPGGYGQTVIGGTSFTGEGSSFMSNIDLFSSLAASGLSEEVIIVGATYRMSKSSSGSWNISDSVTTMGNCIKAILNHVVTNYSTYADSVDNISSVSEHFGIEGASTGGAVLSRVLQNKTVQNYFGYISYDQSAYYSMNNNYSSSIPLKLFIAQNAGNDYSHNAQKYIPDWSKKYSNIKQNENAIGIKLGNYGHGGISTSLCYYNILVSFFRY